MTNLQWFISVFGGIGLIVFVVWLVKSSPKKREQTLGELAHGQAVGPSGSAVAFGAGESARLRGARRHRHGVPPGA